LGPPPPTKDHVIQRMRNPKIVMVRYGSSWFAKRLSYNIASISETTTPIDKKFQDNICTTKMCPAMQYCDVITNPRWRTTAILKIAKSMIFAALVLRVDDCRPYIHTFLNC